MAHFTGASDKNISFAGLCQLLYHLGFKERIRSSHHIFTKEGIEEILNLQPKYEVIICWSKEDQTFIAEVPGLPGCAADGTTYQEALTNAEVIIKEWIETARN